MMQFSRQARVSMLAIGVALVVSACGESETGSVASDSSADPHASLSVAADVMKSAPASAEGEAPAHAPAQQ